MFIVSLKTVRGKKGRNNFHFNLYVCGRFLFPKNVYEIISGHRIELDYGSERSILLFLLLWLGIMLIFLEHANLGI